MTEYRRNEVVSGLFVILSLAVLALFAFRIGGLDLMGPFRGESLECKAYFTDVKTLKGGARVMAGGQDVGKVTAVRMQARALDEQQVARLIAADPSKASTGLAAGMQRQLIEVTFELSDPELVLNLETTSVTLNQGSLLAPHFLELDPGEWSAASPPRRALELADGVEIRAREGTGVLDKLYALVEPAIKQLERALETLNGSLLTTENTGAISATLADLALAMGDLRGIADEVSKLLDRERDPRLHELIDTFGLAAGSLSRGLDKLEAELDPLLAEVHGALDDASGVMLGASGLLEENRAEIGAAIRRMNEASWQLQLAMRKIRANPAVLFFGDEETDFEAAQRDESGLRYSGRVAPYTQKDED